ncbi:hypothetical protein CUPA0004 [Campylobacter upsaliensis RM3195]|nr:hypothetical protein CUPA0004 [Campylobacter upsaliensis RM3195]
MLEILSIFQVVYPPFILKLIPFFTKNQIKI